MNRLRAYFIGKILEQSDDVFEHARAILILRLSFMFLFLIFLQFISVLIAEYYVLAILIGLVALSLCFMPFILKWQNNIDKTTLLFFTVSLFMSFLTSASLSSQTLDASIVSWSLFFLILSTLMLRGKRRILFSGFFNWLIILYVLINIQMEGALTIQWLVQDGADEPPLFVVFVPMLLAVFTVWTHTTTIQEARLTIVSQRETILGKNKDITSSITYAKRIQDAKLPELDKITTALPDSFILFKPKDIVSGDFYFFTKANEKIFLAAADCTGHGVPGAFMSLIGSGILETAVKENPDASHIISALNRGIKNTLRQSDEDDSTRDGMDIALCVLDLNNFEMEFSGANRPLWILRKNEQKIEEIKATKKAIGGLTENDQHFESHKIQISSGDIFYLFSDGYADTFSGKTDKKLTTKKFRELLLEIRQKTMAEQREHLEDFIESWKAGTEQVDDILVIGVRI